MLKSLLLIWGRFPKFLKVLSSIIGTVVLSALGTPVWNFILKPFFIYIINTFYNLFFTLSKSVEVYTFTSIGKMSISSWIVDIKILFLTVICMPVLFLTMNMYYITRLKIKKKDKKQEKEKIEDYYKKRKNLNKACFIMSWICIFILFATLFQDIYLHQKKLDYDNLLIDVRPYLTDYEYYLFNAKFRKIKSRSDYDNIINQLTLLIESEVK